MNKKFKGILFILPLVLIIGIYVYINYTKDFNKKESIADENTQKGIYYGVIEDTDVPGAQGKIFNNKLFESPLKYEKEVIITDRNFLSWFDELQQNPERYSGMHFEMTGNIFNIEIDDKMRTFAGRYVFTSPLEDKEMKGIIIKTDKSFINDEWVYIKGTMDTDTLLGAKIPVVRVEYIEKAQNKGIEFIYEF